MAIKPQGIAGLNVGDTNTLLNQMGKPKSLGDLANLYGQGILGEGPLKNKFVPPIGKFKTSPPIFTSELVKPLNKDDTKTDKKNANIGDKLSIVVATYSLS